MIFECFVTRTYLDIDFDTIMYDIIPSKQTKCISFNRYAVRLLPKIKQLSKYSH
jgi:hypothetical protein